MNATTSSAAPTRRSWKTFSLKALLLLVLVVGCLLGCYAALRQKVEAERRAVAEIVRLGGSVWYEVESKPGEFTHCPDPPGPRWVRNLLGDTVYADRTSVYFTSGLLAWSSGEGDQVFEEVFPEFGDEHIWLLVELPKLRAVFLHDSDVTPEGARQLKQLLPDCEVLYEGEVVKVPETAVAP
jgi:hypothetical protein